MSEISDPYREEELCNSKFILCSAASSESATMNPMFKGSFEKVLEYYEFRDINVMTV